MSFATVYGLAFALATALITHTALYHGKDMWRQAMRPSNPIDEDVHSRLMRNYPEVRSFRCPDTWCELNAFPQVPDWWYYGFVVFFSAMAIITVTVSSTFESPSLLKADASLPVRHGTT